MRVFFLLLLLAACGGSGGGGGDDPRTENGGGGGGNGGGGGGSDLPDPRDEITDAATQDLLRDRLIADYTPLDYTPVSRVPTTGTLRYDGIWSGALSNRRDALTDSLLGQVRVDVRFTATSVGINGAVRNLTDAAGRALSGTLALGQGALDRAGDPFSDATLTFTATGTLRDASGTTLTLDTRGEGDFLTEPYNAIGGEVLGRVISGGRAQSITGSFIAER